MTAELTSITDVSVEWPTFREVLHVLLLRDYNTRLVVLSTAMLGTAAGLIGTFLFLRKRALMGDVLSHATLPGIALAFMVMVALGGDGKNLAGLLAGAAVFGLLGVGCVLLIRGLTRLKDDAALGIVLSVFFGLGIALMGLVQDMPQGSAAGLGSFIYGKTASIVRSDLWLIAAMAVSISIACLLLYKEFAILCFDEGFAGAQGWPVHGLDVAMMALATGVTVIGLQAVGLILIIALLIIPPAAARFWTERLGHMMIGSAAIGAAGGWVGASMSALVPRLPAGAIIVVTVAAVFGVSMIVGARRGALVRLSQQWRLTRRIERQHLLRAIFERAEVGGTGAVRHEDLLTMRSWSRRRLRRAVAWARRRELLDRGPGDTLRLSDAGTREAVRLVRNHRLWELFLITYAEIAPSHVDRDADQIEHVLGPEMISELEALLAQRPAPGTVPPSPHAV